MLFLLDLGPPFHSSGALWAPDGLPILVMMRLSVDLRYGSVNVIGTPTVRKSLFSHHLRWGNRGGRMGMRLSYG